MVIQLRAAQTREEIILGAAKTIDEKGYRKSSISEIARSCGVTPGGLYFHFRSKDEIAHGIIQTQHQISLQRAEEIFAKNLPAVETLLQISAGLSLDIIDNSLIRVGTHLNTEVPGRPFMHSWKDWADLVALLLRKGIEEGSIRETIDIPKFSYFISTAYAGVLLVSEITSNYKDLMEKIFEMWIVILQAIAKIEKQPFLIEQARKAHLSYN